MDKNKSKSQLKIAVAAAALVALAYGINHFVGEFNNSSMPAQSQSGLSSEERNAKYAEEDARRTQEEAQLTENMTEAPNEGLQRHVYEEMEQPAPLIGKREMLLFKTQFVISYNIETLCPNYVCWCLTSDRCKGDAERSDNFKGDPSLSEATRVETYDFNNSGYDRGHMCPAADNRNDEQAMDESFFMTNVCPQNHNLNEGDWNELEKQCRRWAKNYGPLYICCGPIFDSDSPRTIGKRKEMKVSVPDRFFKVILSLDRVPKAIGFIYPNAATSKEMRSYAVSVDEVEKITGLDFFPQLPDDQETELESRFNPASWGI